MWHVKQAAAQNSLDLYIYSEVQADGYDWWTGRMIESETSAEKFREMLTQNAGVKTINLYINSIGGSVFEGTAIYNQLKRHPAQKIVHIDGFACSIASVIAMAGDVVIMPRNTMMMIHNMINVVVGNAQQMRKAADDLDVINSSGRQAYLMKGLGKLSEDELVRMMDAETWLSAEECIRLGLADQYAEQDADMETAAEMMKQMTGGLQQQVAAHKSLVAQMRALADAEPRPAEPKPGPPEPQQNRTMNLISSLFR